MIFKVPANIDKPLYSQIVKNPWDLKQGTYYTAEL